jgi:hypothetical protein
MRRLPTRSIGFTVVAIVIGLAHVAMLAQAGTGYPAPIAQSASCSAQFTDTFPAVNSKSQVSAYINTSFPDDAYTTAYTGAGAYGWPT